MIFLDGRIYQRYVMDLEINTLPALRKNCIIQKIMYFQKQMFLLQYSRYILIFIKALFNS